MQPLVRHLVAGVSRRHETIQHALAQQTCQCPTPSRCRWMAPMVTSEGSPRGGPLAGAHDQQAHHQPERRRSSLLLTKWRHPVSGCSAWEAPGGAIELGESRRCAERALHEATRLATDLASARWAHVHREHTWKGEARSGEEIVCAIHVHAHEVRSQMPPEEERATFLEWRWVARDEVAALDAPVYPAGPFALTESIEDDQDGRPVPGHPNPPRSATARPMGCGRCAIIPRSSEGSR